jgi:hypothetical protein
MLSAVYQRDRGKVMAKKKTKAELLEKINPKGYLIYGIYDFQKKTLIYVHLDKDQVEMEFVLSGYDENEDRYDIVEFHIKLI